jgi:excisionase family DNA binding protein
MTEVARLHPDDIEAIARRSAELVRELMTLPSNRTDEDDADRLLTANAAAALLGVTERYVWKLGRQGRLPRVKVGGKYVRFPRAAVLAYGATSIGSGHATVERPRPMAMTVASTHRVPARSRRRF